MKKSQKIITAVLLIGVLAYWQRGPLENVGMRLYGSFFPCQQPITYSLGTFDSKFGISKTSFLDALKQAEGIWESPIDTQLFTYAPIGGRLTIDLIYDYRQEATDKLRALGFSIGESKANYEILKAEYEIRTSGYAQNKALFEQRLASYNTRKTQYETEVNRQNRRGGATKEMYNQLQTEGTALEAERLELIALQTGLNNQIESINALATVLNRLASALNLNVDQYNDIGNARGEEFTEGLYRFGPDGQEIDIFQYDSQNKLVRVLAHELGHALGIAHVDDPQAIMYRLNQATNEMLTTADLTALKQKCGIN